MPCVCACRLAAHLCDSEEYDLILLLDLRPPEHLPGPFVPPDSIPVPSTPGSMSDPLAPDRTPSAPRSSLPRTPVEQNCCLPSPQAPQRLCKVAHSDMQLTPTAGKCTDVLLHTAPTHTGGECTEALQGSQSQQSEHSSPAISARFSSYVAISPSSSPASSPACSSCSLCIDSGASAACSTGSDAGPDPGERGVGGAEGSASGGGNIRRGTCNDAGMDCLAPFGPVPPSNTQQPAPTFSTSPCPSFSLFPSPPFPDPFPPPYPHCSLPDSPSPSQSHATLNSTPAAASLSTTGAPISAGGSASGADGGLQPAGTPCLYRRVDLRRLDQVCNSWILCMAVGPGVWQVDELCGGWTR